MIHETTPVLCRAAHIVGRRDGGDPLTVDPGEIFRIAVPAAYEGGRSVHGASSSR